MTIKQALVNASNRLKQVSSEANLETAILLSNVLKRDKLWLVTHDDNLLSDEQVMTFDRFVNDRLTTKPLAYIIHKKEFYKRNFYIDEGALIPRPETEYFIDLVSDCIKLSSTADKWTIADIGTGSGCIAISLALTLPSSTIFATEISTDAISVAQKNVKLHGVTERVSIRQGSLIDPVKEQSLDIIVANLPYILSDRIPKLDEQVRDWEPRIALDGGADGFQLYRQLFDQISQLKSLPKIIIGEMDYSHDEIAQQEARTFFPGATVSIKQDHQGLSRFFMIALAR